MFCFELLGTCVTLTVLGHRQGHPQPRLNLNLNLKTDPVFAFALPPSSSAKTNNFPLLCLLFLLFLFYLPIVDGVFDLNCLRNSRVELPPPQLSNFFRLEARPFIVSVSSSKPRTTISQLNRRFHCFNQSSYVYRIAVVV
jgi:hypothetical protein